MIAITKRACEILLHVRISEAPPGPEVGLRLARGDTGQLELFADTEQDGDQVLEHEGVKVLLISAEVSEALAGATIDCLATPEGVRLVVERTTRGSGDSGGNGGPAVA